MLFNSIDFAFFLPLVFGIYWILNGRGVKAQNVFVLLASYVFYGWWDWRFLVLIAASTFVDFFVGRRLGSEEKPRARKHLLWISLCSNLGLLFFFKYYNFFVDSFIASFTFFGTPMSGGSLNIILPVGISFYTFQTLSYTIDIYKRKLEPSKDMVAFASFVSFFPQLVAGPIERASNFLPQFEKKRVFDYQTAVDGLRQMLWGFFKKMVVADTCAEFANLIFDNHGDYTGSTLLLGVIFFSFQIYGDFSGYSDIAIGTSKLFGFRLRNNFAYPYFARDIAEFWRKWHISLSTWFRDYLYIPLGGSKGNKAVTIRNTFAIFLVSGLWHGANWTFVFWGLLHAIFFLPLQLIGTNRKHLGGIAQDRLLPSIADLVRILVTYFLVTLAWVAFRAENLSHAFAYWARIFSPSLFSKPVFGNIRESVYPLVFIISMLIVEWFGRNSNHPLEHIHIAMGKTLRWGIYLVILLILITHRGGQQEFIYFQF